MYRKKEIPHKQTDCGCKHLFKAMAVAGIVQTKNVFKFLAIQKRIKYSGCLLSFDMPHLLY